MPTEELPGMSCRFDGPVQLYLAGMLYLCTAGCQSLSIAPPSYVKATKTKELEQALTLPSKKTFRVAQFVFIADFELNHEDSIFHDLAFMRERIYKDLKLPPSNTLVQVYLFQTRELYDRYMSAKYPDLPKRRAFFVAQPRAVGGTEDLLVYTFWGDRIRQDLRHELTHAVLHGVLKDVPLWLDEGLAEYFESGPDADGLHPTHLEYLRTKAADSFKPSLAHLEQLSQVQQMSSKEYREAWAWVHFMMHSRPETKAILLDYVRQLRTNPNPGPVQPRLAEIYPDLDGSLVAYLDRLDDKMHGQNPQ